MSADGLSSYKTRRHTWRSPVAITIDTVRLGSKLRISQIRAELLPLVTGQSPGWFCATQRLEALISIRSV